MEIFAPESAVPQEGVGFAKRDPQCKEPDDVVILLKQIPVQPGGLVILVVGIVVPALGIHELVASTEHRGAVGKKQETVEVLGLPFLQDYHMVRHPIVAFPSAIPAVGVVTLSGREPQGPIRPGGLYILSNCDQIADRARSRIKTAPIRVSRDARLSGCLSVRPYGCGIMSP